MQAICPLCSSKGNVFFQSKDTYYKCPTCEGIFVDENNRPNLESERNRYEVHENDVNDEGYQKFVLPITSSVMRDFKSDDKGLDFGAGTGPVLSKILQDNKYSIKQYDPFFHIYPELLEQQYDYIASCEVIEHFYNPYKEFKLLKSMLKEGSKLYLMTAVYNEGVDFASWYYKNDPTHVFFYSKKTFEWIKNEFGFSDLEINKKLIILNN